VADEATRPRGVRFEYRFDRLLPAKLEHAYALLVPDQRWPISAPPRVAQEPVDEHPRRHLRARLVRSSA
jgi:hypothetical protein